MDVIEARDVRKSYGGVEALRGLDLRVTAGEVVCLLGPNGAGKTTAIQVMLGLRAPGAGSVRLFGMTPGGRDARSRIGVMLQESGVPEHLTVEELIRLFGSYYPYALPPELVVRRADLVPNRRSQVRTLSGGERQRLYFALAIVGDPDLLFLDEPTVGMDVQARRAFWDEVRAFAGLGKTILFSTHYLEEADAAASRIVVIHEGRILVEGSPGEIKRRVADKTVRMRIALPLDFLAKCPGVRRAEMVNGFAVLYTNEPERVLAELFAAGHQLDDLTVTDTELEAAFVSLTSRAVAA